jgi:predicted nucleotidyltransferase
MKPSVALNETRDAVRSAAGRFRAANPRIFGSVLHGSDRDGSDLDLLADALPGATLFDLGGLRAELEALPGVRVDLLTPGDLLPKFRDQVLAEAQPV